MKVPVSSNPGREDGSPSTEAGLFLAMTLDGDQPRTAQEFAYETVRRGIMRGELAPGTRLAQSQLAKQLKISTTPVREALGRLASDGFVRIDSHRGAIVRGMDEEELAEIYELRILLEPLAAYKAAERITEAQLAQAEALWKKMEDKSDVGAWSEWNSRFHAIFAEATQSPNLTQILRGLRDSAAPYVRWSIVASPGRYITANEDHMALIESCRARDADRAAAIEEQHLRTTLAALMDNEADGTALRSTETG